MEKEKFDCLICSMDFTAVGRFKQHLQSGIHRMRYQKVYPHDVFERTRFCYTPRIFIKDPFIKLDPSRPILGLSQMTLIFSSEDFYGSFYLCHICEQKFHVNDVKEHISHVNHYSNYFAYTDPNALSFLSIPSEKNLHNSLMDNIKKEHVKTGVGQLQMLHMPDRLFKECTRRNFCQVMALLDQNKSLSDKLKERKPERMRIQTYKDDSNRIHPLIGLQYIVECISNGHIHLRHYLCTLCSLHLSSSMIIRHLLSFDHVFIYISLWHPSTLKDKESYKKDNSDFACTMANFAKQSEELHGPQEIQQIRLETSQILSVLNASFKTALATIELIANKGSLLPTVKPGNKLEPTLPGSDKITTNVKQEGISEPVTSENTTLVQDIKEENEKGTTEQSVTPAAPSYSFHCQNCSENFETNTLYFKHLSTSEHVEKFEKNFGAAIKCKPHFPSYKYFEEPDILCAGASLIVTVLSHQLNDEPVHLCFACETVFSRKDIKLHMNSEKHLVQFLLYQNPWQLPFAWKTSLDYPTLKSKACVEEEERGPNKNIKILDVPPNLFPCAALLDFSDVMKKLGQYHPLLKNGVPQQETHSKLQDNDRFPLLGQKFLVKYGQTTSGWKFLCLLCQCSLSSDDFTKHVFSWQHVVAFLEEYHSGTLDLNTRNEEMLLDFAKQAVRIHGISNIQKIEFDTSTSGVMDFSTTVCLLSAKNTRDGKGPLMPSITPMMKLFPRQQSQEKELNLDIKPTNTEICPENPVEKLVDGFQSADQVSHVCISEPNEISLLEKNKLSTEQESKDNPVNPSEPSQSVEMESAKSSSSDFKATMSTAVGSKKQRSTSDMDTSDSETAYDSEILTHKRMCLSDLNENKLEPNLQDVNTAEQCRSSDTAVENSVVCYGRTLQSYIKQENRKPVIGLSAVYECVFNDRPPVYLCECCHLKFLEKHIVNHLVEVWHYTKYLKTGGEILPSNFKFWTTYMVKLATHWEKRKGHGKVNVVKVTQEEYDGIDKTSAFKDGFEIVKKCLARKINFSPTLLENIAEAATTNRQKTSQQDIKVEIVPPSVTTSSNKDTVLTQTLDLVPSTAPAMAADKVFQSLGSTVTVPSATSAPSSSGLSSDGKSEKTRDESESTNVEDSNLKIEDTTQTGAPKSSKPLCRFIMGSVIPEVEYKPVNTQENAIDKIEHTTTANCTTSTPKPTSKPVCKFIPAKSATRNLSTPAMTHLSATSTPESTYNSDIIITDARQTTSPLLVDKVTYGTPTPDVSGSNAVKEASEPQDKAVQSDVVPKGKAEPISGKKTTSESSSSQTKLPSATQTASTPKTSDSHSKLTGIQLKLNVNAASHIKNDDPVLRDGPLTPTTLNTGLQKPTAETSQKVSAETLQIGLDQLIKIKCQEKRLSFCLACSEKLTASNHLTSTTHQMNCVKLKYPGSRAKPGEKDFSKMVARLHDKEKALNVKMIEVSLDCYTDLKSLPNDKAIEKVKDIKRKSSKKPAHGLPSPSTSEAPNSLCDISTRPNISVSSREFTYPHFGKENGQTNPQINSSVQPLKILPVTATLAASPSPPVQKPTSKVAPRMIKGLTTDDRSNLSHFLSVHKTSVIGLCLVWECREMPHNRPTFYLCESCSLTISVNEICDHMKSTKHNYKYLMRQYPRFMYWTEEEWNPAIFDYFTNYTACLVKGRETSMDAQTVLLSEEWFEWMRTAPFVKALNVVQRIKQEKKTTSLPPTVMSLQEVEPREQQGAQPTVDTNTLTDLSNQMEISILENPAGIMDTQHEVSSGGNVACENAELCTSPSDTNCMSSPRMTEFPDVQSENVTSTNSPEQPDAATYFATDQNLEPSPKDENQEHFKSDIKVCSDLTNPLSHNSSAMFPFVYRDEATSLDILTDANIDSKPKADIQLCSPPVQEKSTVSPNHLEDNVTKAVEEDQMTEESSPHGHSDTNVVSTSLVASSMVDHNANEYSAHDPEDKTDDEKAALDKHYYLLLINLLKQTKNDRQRAASTRNQSSEACTAISAESNVELCAAPQHTTCDVGQPPNTDTVIDKEYNTVAESKSGSSAELHIKNSTCADESNENKQKTTCVDMINESSDNETTISELTIQQSQEQLLQSKDDEPRKESKGLKQLQLLKIPLQEKETMIQEIKPANSILDSEVSIQTSQLEIEVKQPESECSSADNSEIQHSQYLASQQNQELQLKSDTQNTLDKLNQSQTLQAQVRAVQITQNQELQLQPHVAQSQNDSQQAQGQKEHGQSDIAEVHLHTRQSQVEPQMQVVPTQFTQQTQGQTQAGSIVSIITPRPNNAKRLRSDGDDPQNLNRNTSFQDSQAPPSFATTPPVSSSMMVTGDRGQWPQTAYPTNAEFSNSQALYGVHHGSAYPSHLLQLQPLYYNPSVLTFLQNGQQSGFSGWFNPNTQLQPGAQNYLAWHNTTVGERSNVAYPNTASFNTVNNQSYTYNYNTVQEYNNVIVQNVFYPSSMPPHTNSQFFPHRQ